MLTEPQRALLSTISASQEVVAKSELELSDRAKVPELGSDSAALKWKQVTLDTSKQNVSYQLAAMNAATAQVSALLILCSQSKIFFTIDRVIYFYYYVC